MSSRDRRRGEEPERERSFEDISSYSEDAKRQRRISGLRELEEMLREDEEKRARRAAAEAREEPLGGHAHTVEIPLWQRNEDADERNAGSLRRLTIPQEAEPEDELFDEEETPRLRRRRTSPPPEEEPDEAPPFPEIREKGAGRRRAVLGAAVLLMAALTVLLGAYLVFKIGDIRVTGDSVPGVSQGEIVQVSGLETGNPLLFFSSGAVERAVEARWPYVANAQVIRHLPDTVEIRLTAAEVSASLDSAEGWLFLSGELKLLETANAPAEGSLAVLGPEPVSPQVGEPLVLEDDAALQALADVLAAIPPALENSELPGRFTLLDLRDLSAIRLYYADRVEFLLGNVLDLPYKVEAGCRFLADPSAGENGVMDLSSANETKRAIFTAGIITVPELTRYREETGEGEAENEPPVPEASPTPAPRSDGIPTEIYDGD